MLAMGQDGPGMAGKAPTAGGYAQVWPHTSETRRKSRVNFSMSLLTRSASLARFARRLAVEKCSITWSWSMLAPSSKALRRASEARESL